RLTPRPRGARAGARGRPGGGGTRWPPAPSRAGGACAGPPRVRGSHAGRQVRDPFSHRLQLRLKLLRVVFEPGLALLAGEVAPAAIRLSLAHGHQSRPEGHASTWVA